jgi:hypothetical protein
MESATQSGPATKRLAQAKTPDQAARAIAPANRIGNRAPPLPNYKFNPQQYVDYGNLPTSLPRNLKASTVHNTSTKPIA